MRAIIRIVWVALLLRSPLGEVARAADLRAGAARVVISPPAGVPMAGYYATRLAEGVHDDLYAKAIVLEHGVTKAALVACDLISLNRDTVIAARAEIERQCGIPGSNVTLSATHSHTGPVLSGAGARAEAQGGTHPVARAYAAALPDKIARAVCLAHERLARVTISAALGREEGLSFNRRYFMTNGSVGWNPGKLNPGIVRPAGPIDPAVPVIYLEAGGAPVATYVNFAMHLDTVGGLQVSADYPYALAGLLAKIKGPEMVTLFTIGTAGDINHVDVSQRDPQKGFGEADRIGTILAGEVIKTYARLTPVTAGPLRAASEIVSLDLPPVTAAEVEQARAIAVRYGSTNEPAFLEKVRAFKVLEVAARAGKPFEVEVQVIVVGTELAWVSLPGEIFVELGLAIKRASPFPITVVAELANGAIGYIPTRKAYAEGNYEPVSARCAAGSGEKLVAAALRLLRQVQ